MSKPVSKSGGRIDLLLKGLHASVYQISRKIGKYSSFDLWERTGSKSVVYLTEWSMGIPAERTSDLGPFKKIR